MLTSRCLPTGKLIRLLKHFPSPGFVACVLSHPGKLEDVSKNQISVTKLPSLAFAREALRLIIRAIESMLGRDEVP